MVGSEPDQPGNDQEALNETPALAPAEFSAARASKPSKKRVKGGVSTHDQLLYLMRSIGHPTR